MLSCFMETWTNLENIQRKKKTITRVQDLEWIFYEHTSGYLKGIITANSIEVEMQARTSLCETGHSADILTGKSRETDTSYHSAV